MTIPPSRTRDHLLIFIGIAIGMLLALGINMLGQTRFFG